MIKKIAVTGSESTGKSTLSQYLAKHYNTLYVSEYAREYIELLDRPYNYNDILTIAQRQIENEKSAINKANRYLFSDTELIVTKIWCLHKYQQCHEWILQQIHQNTYDLFLLCDIDLPWEYDPQREHPHLREYFFNVYKKELENYGFPYIVISGNYDERLQKAINAIDKL